MTDLLDAPQSPPVPAYDDEALLKRAVDALASVCDYAQEDDGAGFNKPDAGLGHRLAALPTDLWEPKERREIWERLRKYRVQLLQMGIPYEAITVPPPAWEPSEIEAVEGRRVERVRFIERQRGASLTDVDKVAARAATTRRVTLSTVGSTPVFRVEFPYSAPVVEALKAVPCRRRFDPQARCWWLQGVGLYVARFEAFCRTHYFMLDDKARAALERLAREVPPSGAIAADTTGCGDDHQPERQVTVGTSRRVELLEDGAGFAVYFAYDAGLVDAIKRLVPTSRWNKTLACWIVTARFGAVEGLARFAAAYGFEVAPAASAKLAAVAADHVASLEASRAVGDDSDVDAFLREFGIDWLAVKGLRPRSYQAAGVRYALKARRMIFGDEPGCVDGAAVVHAHRAGRGFRISLAELYGRFQKWCPRIPTMVRSLVDGELRQHRLVDVLDQGTKPCIEVRLASGRSITVTPDHKIARLGGEWTRADSLTVGDAVLANGVTVCVSCGTEGPVTTYRYAKFRGSCRKCVYRRLRENHPQGRRFVDKDGYVRVTGYFDHPRAKTSEVYEHLVVMEEHLGRRIEWPEQVHHKNEDRADNAIGNLEVVTPTEHHRRHRKHLHMNRGRAGRGGEIWLLPEVDHVSSISAVGDRRVYDLVMADPHRNFVANGVVVHNCGKTPQSLLTLEAANAFPALVVCPATLVYNWYREARRWLRSTRTISILGEGHGAYHVDLLIINYDRLTERRTKGEERPKREKGKRLTEDDVPLSYHARQILALPNRQAIIADESHALKDSKSLRSQAVKLLARGRPWRLFLTGTFIVNRPIEAVSQLDILGQVEALGGFWFLVRRYCAAHQKRIGWKRSARMIWDMTGSSHVSEFNDRLRKVCYLRREKSQVLGELPPTQTVRLDIDIDNRAEYDRAQADVVAWLREHAREDAAFLERLDAEVDAFRLRCIADGEANVDVAVARERAGRIADYEEGVAKSAERAEALRKIEVLKRIAAEGKLATALEWMADFIDNGKKLIAFAFHKDIQRRLAEAFPGCARIRAEDGPAERDAEVQRFQTDDACRLIVASLSAGGVGWTGTAASDVAFMEFPWTPAALDQAISRAHRLGQRDAVTAWLLAARETVDDDILDLLEAKAAVVGGVNVGTAQAVSRASVATELIGRLRGAQ